MKKSAIIQKIAEKLEKSGKTPEESFEGACDFTDWVGDGQEKGYIKRANVSSSGEIRIEGGNIHNQKGKGK